MATITQIVDHTVTHTVTAATASSTVRAAPQGGILEGSDPSVYDSKNPIIIFIIQVRRTKWPWSRQEASIGQSPERLLLPALPY